MIDIRKISDLSYGVVDGHDLTLDLYLPTNFSTNATRPALLIWIHGGAWRRGSKNGVNTHLVEHGYALASLDFRSSEVAPFPAQIHDIKAAIRFLRHEAKRYGYDVSRIGVLGASSGGHLAALTGVTNGHAELEGDVGDYVDAPSNVTDASSDPFDASSDVQAIVSYFGASNLTTILDQSTPHGLSVRVPALELFLGAQPHDAATLARLASPVFHVDETSPPLLLIHGDQDPQMPVNQSLELYGAYKKRGLDVELEIVHGAAHGGEAFWSESLNQLVKSFLDQRLR